MTNILELLKHEKVEWKKLSDICVRQKGIKITAKQMRELSQENGAVKIFAGGNTVAYVDVNNIKKENIIDKPSIIVKSRGNIDFEYYDNLFTHKNELWSYSIRSNDNIKFIYYFMKLHIEYFKSRAISGKLPQISTGLTDNFLIPIPSLEIQEKIVEILDKFTDYVTELQSELQSRTKQYTYYRDMLLSEEYLNKITKEMEEDRRVRIEKLNDICELKRGKRLVKSELQEEGEFPVYQNSLIPLGYYHESNFDSDKTFIISAGAAGEIIYSDREFWAADDVYVLMTKENISSKFLYYSLLSKQHVIKSKVRKASVPRLSKEDIEKLFIPLPSLSLQNKIVRILDKFQVMLADTKGLLPEEIEQRQKQYEYYREKLLTFEIDCDNTHARTHARTLILSSHYYDLLEEVSKFVSVDIKDKVEWLKLEELAKSKLTYGSGAKAVNYDGKIRYIRITDINENGLLKNEKVSPEVIEDKYILEKGDILFARSGATVGKNYLYNSDELSIYAGYLIKFSPDFKRVNSKYVYYCVNNTEYDKFILSSKSTASQPNINAQQYSNFKILIPPLHVQQHIVSILDKFDTLVNDIKEGLPKEIELRQKQYEYWREQLLSFNR